MNEQNKSESRFIKGRTDIKIVVLGSSGTGKTSLCNLWINNTFSEEYKATVMSEFSFKMYGKNRLMIIRHLLMVLLFLLY